MNAQPRVLVVDDEPLCRWALRESLSEDGLQVIAADGDVEGESVDAIDVLVIDAAMHDGRALRVLERVRSRSPKCRVVIMTTFDDIALRRLPPLPTTGWRMIQKPFDLRRMVSLVRELAPATRNATGMPPA